MPFTVNLLSDRDLCDSVTSSVIEDGLFSKLITHYIVIKLNVMLL